MTTVLIAEDNVTLLENIADELSFRGYHVLQAVDGQMALDILQKTNPLPDIVVSDIAMPDVDGYQLLEQLRGNPAWESIPVLFLTAYNTDTSIRTSKQLGVDDYITKPFKPDDLVIAMENKLKRIAIFRKQAQNGIPKARQTLLNMMSHELRTPLTAIHGGAGMLAESLQDLPPETAQSLVGVIQAGAERLHRFIEKTLALVQLDSGHLEQAIPRSSRELDLCALATEAIHNIQREFAPTGREVNIAFEGGCDPIYVMGVHEFVKLVVEEPLRNAVAFSKATDPILLSVHQDGALATVTVRDNGMGIPAADVPRVWDRFTQINRDEHEQQGAGIGLTILQESVRLHGGTCQIESDVGYGTTFMLALPVVNMA